MRKIIIFAVLFVLMNTITVLAGFVDNGDGTVTDTATGLMWQQYTPENTYDWESAITYCDSLSLANHDDWRLPNMDELHSLYDIELGPHPYIDTSFFPGTLSSNKDFWLSDRYFWSSTTYVNIPENARYANFYWYDDWSHEPKSNTYYVRAVRDGQSESFDDLVLSVRHTSPSSTVSNTAPTFIWEKDPASTWYKLWVGYPNGVKLFAEWYDATEICSDGNCSVTPALALTSGNYEWYVKSWNDSSKVWSDGMDFTIQGNETPPSKITHTSPSGQLESSSSTFTWKEDPASTWYKVWVGYPGDQKLFAQWYEASDICSGGNCTVTTGTEFNGGDYEWYIKSWNEYGNTWSDGMSFTVSASASGSEITYTLNSDLKTSKGTIKGIFNLAETELSAKNDFGDPQTQLVLNSSGNFTMEEYTLDVNNVTFNSYLCEDYPISGNVAVSGNDTIYFTEDCTSNADLDRLLSVYSSGIDLIEPLTTEVSVILSAALFGSSSVPLTITPPLDQLTLETLPSSIRMKLDYGNNGYTAEDGATMTGSLTLNVTQISVTAQGISLTASVVADDLARNGELILDGSAAIAVVVGLTADRSSSSLTMTVTVNNMVSPAGSTSGQISVSAPYFSLDLEDIAFNPIIIGFTNFQTSDITITSGTIVVSMSGTP